MRKTLWSQLPAQFICFLFSISTADSYMAQDILLTFHFIVLVVLPPASCMASVKYKNWKSCWQCHTVTDIEIEIPIKRIKWSDLVYQCHFAVSVTSNCFYKPLPSSAAAPVSCLLQLAATSSPGSPSVRLNSPLPWLEASYVRLSREPRYLRLSCISVYVYALTRTCGVTHVPIFPPFHPVGFSSLASLLILSLLVLVIPLSFW